MLRFAGAIACALSMVGCATFVRGTNERVEVQSFPPGADVAITLTPYCDSECLRKNYPDTASRIDPQFDRPRLGPACVTPCAIAIERSDVMTLNFTKVGYEPRTVVVRPTLSAGAALTVGNAIIGGASGLVIDAASGAGQDHCPNPIIVKLRTSGSKESDAPLNTECAAKPLHDAAARPSYQ